MHVSEFFLSFLVAPDVEVVIATLPELRFIVLGQLPGCPLFEHLKRYGQQGSVGFADEHVNVLGHEDVAYNGKLKLLPDGLELVFEAFVCGDEVE